jgi:hypothetical protein
MYLCNNWPFVNDLLIIISYLIKEIHFYSTGSDENICSPMLF